jgi:hypothetical protein
LWRRHFIEGRADDFYDSQFEEKRMACQKKCVGGEQMAAEQDHCGLSDEASERQANGSIPSGSIN